MTNVRFRVFGVPQPKGSMKAFVPKGWTRPIVTATNASTARPWAALVTDAARQACPSLVFPSGVAVALALTFRLPKPQSAPKRRVTVPSRKPDIDKLARLVLDALTGIIWQDDAQVVELVARKDYATLLDGDAPGLLVHATAAVPAASHARLLAPLANTTEGDACPI